jgi:hypothetical protein
MSGRAGRGVLLAVVALHLVSDNALSPFYPQLFAGLFGVTDLSATGTYVWVCRAAALVALPLWGLAARRWAARHLVVAGLLASSVLEVTLAFAPSYLAFTVLSAALVATTMSMALAYPALVALGDGADRLPQVRAFAVVTHGATIAATLVGAGIMALPNVRVGIGAFALVDLLLAWCCFRLLGRSPAGAPVAARPVPTRPVAEPPVPEPPVPEPPVAEPPGPHRRTALGAVAVVALVVGVAEVGRSVVRPFFTAYADSAGLGGPASALLFLLPSVAVLAVLPFAGPARRRLGRALLPAAFLLAAVGLAVQAAGPHPVTLAGGRLLFGAGLGLGHLALDLWVFAATRAEGSAFAAVETARSAALLFSPVLATAAVTVALPLPLAVGAAVFAILAAVLAADRRPCRPARTAVTPPLEETRVVQPVR